MDAKTEKPAVADAIRHSLTHLLAGAVLIVDRTIDRIIGFGMIVEII